MDLIDWIFPTTENGEEIDFEKYLDVPLNEPFQEELDLEAHIKMASTSKEFKEGDLVWAKMKGFPPWPAKVLGSDSADVLPGRIKVMFFGTGDTAFMKTEHMHDYREYRSQFEVPRKQHKDFKKAVDEVRLEAGFPVTSTDSMNASTSREGDLSTSSHFYPGGRSRLSSSKVIKDVYLFDRKRTLSDGTSGSNKSRSRASSVASMLKQLRDAAKKRKPGSESSNGSKHQRLISGINEKEFFDNFLAPYQSELPILDGDIQLVMNDAASRKSGRSRASSSIFHEMFNRGRHRSGGSQSERNRNGNAPGPRTRTISGMSDILEDLLGSNSKFTPEEFLTVINTLSSEEDQSGDEQSGTPDQTPLMPPKRCIDCNYECQLYGIKWRCTNKSCLKWNGVNTGFENELNGSSQNPDYSRYDDEALRAAAGIMSPQSTQSDEIEKHLYKVKSKKLKHRVKQEKLTLDNLDATLPLSPDKSTIALLPKRDRSPIKSADRDYFPHTRIKQEAEHHHKRKRDSDRRVQVISPPVSKSASPPRRGRPPKNPKEEKPTPVKAKTYKVEKTPPIGPSGARECIFCKGQVRPQMCGGSKHRWRCVDKKCRKWYGWVRSHEIVPEVTGKRKILDDKDVNNFKQEVTSEDGSPYKRLGKSKKDFGLKIRLKNSMKKGMVFKIGEADRIKRKYTRRRDMDFEGGMAPKRDPPSPLTERQMSFHASSMERRSRWWTGEKRRVDVSPTREFRTGINDVAASFRIVAHAMRSAAVTRADEQGTVSGTLDLLMDSLMASLPPLFTLLQNVPKLKQDPEVLQRIWNAAAIHTPIFQ